MCKWNNCGDGHCNNNEGGGLLTLSPSAYLLAAEDCWGCLLYWETAFQSLQSSPPLGRQRERGEEPSGRRDFKQFVEKQCGSGSCTWEAADTGLSAKGKVARATPSSYHVFSIQVAFKFFVLFF